MPAKNPASNAINAVLPIMNGWAVIDKLASTNLANEVVLNNAINNIAIRYDRKLTITASEAIAERRALLRAPRTRCVLIFLIRIGVSAVLKLVKLMDAMAIITIAIANKIINVCLLAFDAKSYCISGKK